MSQIIKINVEDGANLYLQIRKDWEGVGINTIKRYQVIYGTCDAKTGEFQVVLDTKKNYAGVIE